jgi:GxxExxY protein
MNTNMSTKNKATNTNNKYILKEIKSLKKEAEKWRKTAERAENKLLNLQQKMKEKKANSKLKNLPQLEAWRPQNELAGLLQNIVTCCRETYAAFPFGAKEGYFQDYLQELLVTYNYMVQREVNVNHCTKLHGKSFQLGNNHGGRVDLMLKRWRMVMELKATGKLTSTEHYQTMNYIEQKRVYDGWGDLTQGLLINFGDTNLEIWYMRYNIRHHKYERVLLCNDERVFPDTIDTQFLM